jgi:hypothetical protein
MKTSKYVLAGIMIGGILFSTSCSSNDKTGMSSKNSITEPVSTSVNQGSTDSYKTNGGSQTDSGQSDSELKIESLNYLDAATFYNRYPNGSFDVYEIKNNSTQNSQLVYKVSYIGDTYIIKHYENGKIVKTIGHNSGDKIVRMLNNRTNTSVEMTAQEYNASLNSSKNISPFSFFMPDQYGVSQNTLFKIGGKQNVENTQCTIYEALDTNSSPVKRFFISDTYNTAIRIEDIMTNVTTIIKNLKFGNVHSDFYTDLFEMPIVTSDKDVPIEGNPGPTGYFDKIN